MGLARILVWVGVLFVIAGLAHLLLLARRSKASAAGESTDDAALSIRARVFALVLICGGVAMAIAGTPSTH